MIDGGKHENRDGHFARGGNWQYPLARESRPHHLPGMLKRQEEKNRSVPERDENSGWDCGVLPPLWLDIRQEL